MKPVHRGHWELIQRASKNCDKVMVFVSTGDRGGRNGEIGVIGEDIKVLWKQYLMPLLPKNVKVEFVSNPTNRAFDAFQGNDEYYVYTDHEDASRYGVGFLPKNVRVMTFAREGVMDISGTKMRQLLLEGRKEEFVSYLPPGVPGDPVWTLLTDRQRIPW